MRLLAFLLASAVPIASAPQARTVLTLADAVAAALVNNAAIEEARDAVESAQADSGRARAAFRPRFVPSVMGALGRSDSANQAFGFDFSQRFATGTEVRASASTASARNQLGTYYYSDTTLSVTQPLSGGPDPLRRERDRAGRALEASRASVRMTEQQIAVDVAAAYYAIVAQQQVAAIARTSHDRSRQLVEMSEAKLSIGRVSQLDVLRARQLERDAAGQVRAADAAVEDAIDQLRLLIGMPMDEAFAVDPRIPVGAAEEPLSDEAIAALVQTRADVAAARDALSDAERAADSVPRVPLPRLDLKLALTRREVSSTLASSFGRGGFELVPFVGVSLPVDRGSTVDRDASARLEVDRRRRELRTMENTATTEVRRAARRRDRAVAGLQDANAAVALATELVDVAHVRFERGLSNNLDLVSAEADLLVARSRSAGAAAEVAIARLQLEAALGRLDPATEFQTHAADR